MATKLLMGKEVSSHIKKELSFRISKLKEQGVIPGLAAILVGDDPASEVYVRNKSRVFKENNCFSETFTLDASTPEKEVINLIHDLNNDDKFHGILVQLPLPKHIDSRKVLQSVSPDKDVDGFHPLNLGYLFHKT